MLLTCINGRLWTGYGKNKGSAGDTENIWVQAMLLHFYLNETWKLEDGTEMC